MPPIDTILGLIKSGSCTGIAIFVAIVLWKVDRRLADWDKKISVESAEYGGHFCMIDEKLHDHGKRISDHGVRINSVEDEILVIRSKCHGRTDTVKQ